MSLKHRFSQDLSDRPVKVCKNQIQISNEKIVITVVFKCQNLSEAVKGLLFWCPSELLQHSRSHQSLFWFNQTPPCWSFSHNLNKKSRAVVIMCRESLFLPDLQTPRASKPIFQPAVIRSPFCFSFHKSFHQKRTVINRGHRRDAW